ncbi:MAG: hypothetical protein FWC64_00670 [Treponema sp.]|nr:hypothetical protein [Treponema sp.]
MAKNHVDGIISFFDGEFWNDFVDNHISHPDGDVVYHAHIWLDTNIHPDSMFPIMYAYWKAKGHPLDRAIDPMSPKPHVGSLHGCHPIGLGNFDYFYRFNKDVVIGPMPPHLPEAELGHNKLSWGKKYQDEFVKQFQFKVVGEEEDAMIRAYFKTKHWKEFIAHIMDPQVMHCHANFEINFDPKIFELHTREEFKKMGWRLDLVVPCVYVVQGKYTGKNVFLAGHPEKVFDTCWKFNPDVVIKPAEDNWIYGQDPGFDIWRRSLLSDVLSANDFYRLTDSEIAEVIASFKK